MLKHFENTERQGVIGIVTSVRGLEGHGLLCTNTDIAPHADSLGLHWTDLSAYHTSSAHPSFPTSQRAAMEHFWKPGICDTGILQISIRPAYIDVVVNE